MEHDMNRILKQGMGYAEAKKTGYKPIHRVSDNK